jgi:hypothetical protein
VTDAEYKAAIDRIAARLALALSPMGWTVRVRPSLAPHSTVLFADFTLHVRTPGHPLQGQILNQTVFLPDKDELEAQHADRWISWVAEEVLTQAAGHILDALPPTA